MTWEELAPYGIGEPDADGIYPDYRVPSHLKPEAPTPAATSQGRPVWWRDIAAHWSIVVCEMASRYHVDLYDPAVLARPWPGVRTMILGLVADPTSLLAQALRGDDREPAGR